MDGLGAAVQGLVYAFYFLVGLVLVLIGTIGVLVWMLWFR